MITAVQIRELIESFIADTELYLVDVHVGQGNVISVFLDSDKGVGIDDCVKVSRHIESNFDREVEDFELQVASAGLDLPFKIKKQYIKNIGREIEVITRDGQKRKGTLTEVNEEFIVLVTKEKQLIEGKKKKEIVDINHQLPFEQIKSSKIIIKF
jgi:ribosome maturation factor RimP